MTVGDVFDLGIMCAVAKVPIGMVARFVAIASLWVLFCLSVIFGIITILSTLERREIRAQQRHRRNREDDWNDTIRRSAMTSAQRRATDCNHVATVVRLVDVEKNSEDGDEAGSQHD